MIAEPVPPELLSRAMKPNLVFGREVLTDLSREWGRYLLITMSEIYEAAQPLLANPPPPHVFFVRSLDRRVVEDAERSLPQADAIVGIGGGMSLDLAKYVGWKRGQDPILCPSIASVDACLTNTIAVRDDGKVHYIGFVAPRAVVSDFALMTNAPKRLNRAGIGDILSIHTGCHDWKLAAEQGETDYVNDVAMKVTALFLLYKFFAVWITEERGFETALAEFFQGGLGSILLMVIANYSDRFSLDQAMLYGGCGCLAAGFIAGFGFHGSYAKDVAALRDQMAQRKELLKK